MRFLPVLIIMLAVAPTAAAQRIPAPIGVRASQVQRSVSPILAGSIAPAAQSGGGTPSWVKWGLIGSAAGALTFPLLSTLASDSEHNASSDAAAGAVIGVVIVGGGVALWQAICSPGSSSRRAGMCGR